jgi:hypothetical protein
MKMLQVLVFIISVITLSNCARGGTSKINGVDLDEVIINIEHNKMDITDIVMGIRSSANIDIFVYQISGENIISVPNKQYSLWDALKILKENSTIKVSIDDECFVCVDLECWDMYMKNVKNFDDEMPLNDSKITFCCVDVSLSDMIAFIKRITNVDVKISEKLEKDNKNIDGTIIFEGINTYKAICWLSALVHCEVQFLNGTIHINSKK